METKDKKQLTNDGKKVMSELLHVAIHDLHENSNFLLDDDVKNDMEAMSKMHTLIGDVGKYFQLRMALTEN